MCVWSVHVVRICIQTADRKLDDTFLHEINLTLAKISCILILLLISKFYFISTKLIVILILAIIDDFNLCIINYFKIRNSYLF